jgi:hypothetical protein
METIPLNDCTSNIFSRITTKFISYIETLDQNNKTVAFVMYINLYCFLKHLF